MSRWKNCWSRSSSRNCHSSLPFPPERARDIHKLSCINLRMDQRPIAPCKIRQQWAFEKIRRNSRSCLYQYHRVRLHDKRFGNLHQGHDQRSTKRLPWNVRIHQRNSRKPEKSIVSMNPQPRWLFYSKEPSVGHVFRLILKLAFPLVLFYSILLFFAVDLLRSLKLLKIPFLSFTIIL